PIRRFRNERGKFAAWETPIRWTGQTSSNFQPTTLAQLNGWWNSVAAGDFDGDGRLDLVAGNWGRNTSRQRFLSEPVRLYYGETEGTRHLELIEARTDPGLHKLVPARDWSVLSSVFPVLQER